MKKLIHSIVAVAFVGTIVSNPIATFAVAADGSSDNIVMQNITDDQLSKIINQRIQNPDLYSSRPEIFLNLKPNPLSDAIQKSLNEPKLAFQAKPDPFTSSKDYGSVTDPNTGITLLLKKTPKAKLSQMAPARLSHAAAFLNATKEAAGPYGMSFGVEALTFYAGVGANTVLDLLLHYEKNPMALEMFVEQLKDPIAQVGFFAFMVGNRYAQTVFQDMLSRSSNKALQRTMAPMLGFLAMGVGSTFSNISHDLVTLTKGCSVAIAQQYKPEYNTSEKVAAKCQEGWEAVMNSDNLFRYITSVISVTAAAVLSSIATQGYKSVAKKTLPIDEFKLLFRKILRRPLTSVARVAEVAPVGKGIRGLGIKIADLVIFLQADELLNPPIYHFVESKMNSGPKLAFNRSKVNSLIAQLDSRNWKDDTSPTCKNAMMHASQNRQDPVPKWILNELQACGENTASLYPSLQEYHEKNKKWRETLTYDFMSSYSNWMRFIGEFSVMHDVSREFFSQLIAYSANREHDMKSGSYSYNPLAFDSPFYGVNTSENLKVSDPLDFRAANASKAMRIVEALPKIDGAIATISKMASPGDVVKSLKGIKALVEIYKKSPTLANQDSLAKAIVLLNALDDSTKKSRDSLGLASWRNASPRQLESQVNTRNKFTIINNIRRYLGNPTPLQAGSEAFYKLFNDWVKTEKPDFVKLFDEKGTPADTITWYAACGNDVTQADAHVDKRRSGFASFIDKSINAVAEVTNKITGSHLKADYSPALNVFETIRFGTGVDFYIPKITTGNLGVCSADKSMSKYIIGPRTGKNAILKGPDGKKYDSIFAYLANNIRPEVLNIGKADDGTPLGPNFDGWWAQVITPKYLKAYDGFIKDYDVLINETYRTAVDGEGMRYVTNPINGLTTALANMSSGPTSRNNDTMLGFQKVISMPRSFPTKNANNLVQSYVDELNTYLQVLDRVYATSPELAQLRSPIYAKNFKDKLFTLRALVYDLLNDFRNYNTKGITFPTIKTGPDGVPVIVKDAAIPLDIQQEYAIILLQLNDVFEALGFGSEYVNAAAPNTVYFKSKNGIDTVPPLERLKLRTDKDPAIKDNFDVYKANYMSRQQPELYPLTYGLKEENFKVNQSGVLKTRDVVSVDLINFSNNDRLTMSFIAANELFALLEDIYTNVSILNAARPDSTFKAIEMPKNAPTGKGSRSF